MAQRLSPYRIAGKEYIKFRGVFGSGENNNVADEYVPSSDNLQSFKLRSLDNRAGQKSNESYSGDIHAVRDARTIRTVCEGNRIWAQPKVTSFSNKPQAYPWRSGYIAWDADDLPDIEGLSIHCYDLEYPDYMDIVPENYSKIITPDTWSDCFSVSCSGLWEELGELDGYVQIADNADLTFPLSGVFTNGFDGCYRENEMDTDPGDRYNDGGPNIPQVPPWTFPVIPGFVLPEWPEMPEPELPPVPPEILECEPETISLSVTDFDDDSAGEFVTFLLDGYSETEVGSGSSSVSWRGYPQTIIKSVSQYEVIDDDGESANLYGTYNSDDEFLDSTGGVSVNAKTEGGTNVVFEYDPKAYPSQNPPTSNAIIVEKTRALTGQNTCEKSGNISYSVRVLPGFPVGTIIRGTITRTAGSLIEKKYHKNGIAYYVMNSEISTKSFMIAVGVDKFVIEKDCDYSTEGFTAGAADTGYPPLADMMAIYGRPTGYTEIDSSSDSVSISSTVGWQISGLSTQWRYISNKWVSIVKNFDTPYAPTAYNCMVKIPYIVRNSAEGRFRITNVKEVNNSAYNDLPDDCDTATPPSPVQLLPLGCSYWLDPCDPKSSPYNDDHFALVSSSDGPQIEIGSETITFNSSSLSTDTQKVNAFMKSIVPHNGTNYIKSLSGDYEIDNLDEINAMYQDLALYLSIDGDIRHSEIMKEYGDTIEKYVGYINTGSDESPNFSNEYIRQEALAGYSGGFVGGYQPRISFGSDYQDLWDFPVRTSKSVRDTIQDNTIVFEATYEPEENITVDLPLPEASELPDLVANPYVQKKSAMDDDGLGLIVPDINPPASYESSFKSGDIEILVLSYAE